MESLQGIEVVRATPVAIRARRDDDQPDGMPRMEVKFSAYANWYEIDSFYEGRFLESVDRGAFAKTIRESRDRVRVMFDHGHDPQIGNKSLGTVVDLREDKDGAVGVVQLFDTSYTRDLLPGIEAGAYGSSMRMVVTRDEWNDAPERSAHNPDGIPERTIKEVKLLEFGPVAWPANPEATATAMRSGTDAYYERADIGAREAALRARPQTCTPPQPAPDDQSTRAADGAAETAPPAPAIEPPGGLTPAQRREALFNLARRSQHVR